MNKKKSNEIEQFLKLKIFLSTEQPKPLSLRKKVLVKLYQFIMWLTKLIEKQLVFESTIFYKINTFFILKKNQPFFFHS